MIETNTKQISVAFDANMTSNAANAKDDLVSMMVLLLIFLV